jgi:hypothetical protein
MGHTQDEATPCGNNGCTGTKTTVYKYDDWGNCIGQTMYPCNVCGQ